MFCSLTSYYSNYAFVTQFEIFPWILDALFCFFHSSFLQFHEFWIEVSLSSLISSLAVPIGEPSKSILLFCYTLNKNFLVFDSSLEFSSLLSTLFIFSSVLYIFPWEPLTYSSQLFLIPCFAINSTISVILESGSEAWFICSECFSHWLSRLFCSLVYIVISVFLNYKVRTASVCVCMCVRVCTCVHILLK